MVGSRENSDPMEKTSKNVALKIEEHILDNISSGIWPADTALPSIRTCARVLHVAPNTVAKAYSQLARLNHIRRNPVNRRFYVPGLVQGSDSVARPHFESRKEKKTAALRENILSGMYGESRTLPSMRELQKQLHCSYATVKSALACLSREGIIERQGNFYTRSYAPKPSASVYLTTPRLKINSHYYDHLIQGIEQALSVRGWGQLNYFFQRNSRSVPPPSHDVAGYIVPRWREEKFVPWRRFPAIPSVIIDTEYTAGVESIAAPNVFIIRPDNRHAGAAIAGHLLGRGNRMAAFFTHVPTTFEWVRQRLESVTAAFAESRPGQSRRCRFFGLTEEGATVKKKTVFDDDMKALSKAFGSEQQRKCGLPLDKIEHMFRGSIWKVLERLDLYAQMKPLFEAALLDKDITAWVCVNDNVAHAALTFLNTAGIEVPGRIAVTGFDDIAEAKVSGLTTYNFHFDRMGYRAVEFLAQGRERSPGKGKPRVMPGALCIRKST